MFEFTAPQLPLWSAADGVEGWAVRESPRARRLTVRVHDTGRVEVIVPRRTSQRMVANHLHQHREWIERKRMEVQRNAAPPQPFPPDAIQLPACDTTWRIQVAGGRTRPRVRELAPGLLEITGTSHDTLATRRALRRWLMTKALESLAPLLAATAREHNLLYRKVVIRRQRTRWGSCSTRGTISLNCSLLFQRREAVRYLLIHELSHTLHMNHSQRFWQCVAGCCPDYASLDRELRDGWRRVPAWVFDR